MLFSVIIPTCNRNDLLEKCLHNLAPEFQTFDVSDFEVIVTDDSSTGDAKQLIVRMFPWVKWVEGPQKGPAANRNNGARHGTGKWLLFIDDDCAPEKDILNEYKDAIGQHPGCLAFEGAILPDDWEMLKKDMTECPVNTEGGYFWSANVCIETETFKRIDGFDENFLIAAQEDQDIFIRLKELTQVKFFK